MSVFTGAVHYHRRPSFFIVCFYWGGSVRAPLFALSRMIPPSHITVAEVCISLTVIDVKHSLDSQQSHWLVKTQPMTGLFCEKAGVISKRGFPSLALGFQ